ncbi:MAG: hypothetical protein UX30_C0003G0117 [Candidatus Saccharibacteria bacterium GW2011_GWA2_46_10]|nr:MAG: hypothetical protein UX30_C0003G0117 [Candidatus Saccharibacteria bacterium GW2011_GWA2_46_10]
MTKPAKIHPPMQTISAQRFIVGIENRVSRADFRPGKAPGPFRMVWNSFREPKWRREFVPVYIEWLEEETDRMVVPLENIDEGPFAAAGLRFTFINKSRRPVEDTPTICINDTGTVYAKRGGERGVWRKGGYFVNPRSLKAEEAAIVELGSKEYALHKKVEKESYQIPPLRLFRRPPPSGVF